MNARNARRIRLGILAARDAELRQYVHLAHPLTRAAARREADNIGWRAIRDTLRGQQAEHVRRFYA